MVTIIRGSIDPPPPAVHQAVHRVGEQRAACWTPGQTQPRNTAAASPHEAQTQTTVAPNPDTAGDGAIDGEIEAAFAAMRRLKAACAARPAAYNAFLALLQATAYPTPERPSTVDSAAPVPVEDEVPPAPQSPGDLNEDASPSPPKPVGDEPLPTPRSTEDLDEGGEYSVQAPYAASFAEMHDVCRHALGMPTSETIHQTPSQTHQPSVTPNSICRESSLPCDTQPATAPRAVRHRALRERFEEVTQRYLSDIRSIPRGEGRQSRWQGLLKTLAEIQEERRALSSSWDTRSSSGAS